MNKFAQAAVEENADENLDDRDRLFLKKKKEEEIRMKLDAFAKELSAARTERKKKH